MFEIGTVKFFDSREGKRFGFLSLQDGEEIFFHFDNGRTIIFDSYPKFVQVDTLQEPKKGDVILFLRGESRKKGTKADVWVYQANWQAILQRFPAIAYYRHWKTTKYVGPHSPEPWQLLWEGYEFEIIQILTTQPEKSYQQQKLRCYPFANDDFDTFIKWEIRQPGGLWKECNNPCYGLSNRFGVEYENR